MRDTVKRATILAHYDRDDQLDDYVRHLVVALAAQSDVMLVVSVSALDDAALAFLEENGIQVILRENRGYDFVSYKVGLQSLSIEDFDEIVLCNDSVYGPFFSLDEVLDGMSGKGCDFWGISESYELSRHLRSYFLVFSSKVVGSRAFGEFWFEVTVLDSKSEIVELYEVGLSKVLLAEGFQMGAYVEAEKTPVLKRVALSWRQYLRTIKRRWRDRSFWLDVYKVLFRNRKIAINPTHMEWRALLGQYSMPFLKIELLRDNPKGLGNLELVDETISSMGEYPVQLIHRHLARMARKDIG